MCLCGNNSKLLNFAFPEINAQVQALAALGSYDRLAIEGDIVFQSPYLPNLGPSDSYQVYQSVLILPEGIGVAIFDMEDYLERRRSPEDDLSLLTRFQSFDDSSSFVKAALLPQVDPMVERLLHRLAVRST